MSAPINIDVLVKMAADRNAEAAAHDEGQHLIQKGRMLVGRNRPERFEMDNVSLTGLVIELATRVRDLEKGQYASE